MDSERLNQIAAFVAAVIAGIIAYIKGGKRAGDVTAGAADAELARLRDERDRQIVLDIKAMRADFEIVMKAMKESMGDRFDLVEDSIRAMDLRLHAMETKIAVVEDRQLRRP